MAGHPTPPGQRDQELVDAFRVLQIELRIIKDRIAAAAGIKTRDLDVLDVIDREGACTPSHLAARTGIAAATLTGVLARLETADWITRTTDPGDGRSARVTSTDRFEEIRFLYRHAGGQANHVFNNVELEHRAAVLSFLQTLADSLHGAAQDIPSKKEATRLRESSALADQDANDGKK